jgi:quercetin dioxygenase-like cupin family protein
MKRIGLSVLAALAPLAVAAQDAAKVDPNHYKVLVDNASVRVLRVSVGAGEKSVTHSHPDAVLVPLTSGKARFTLPDGKTQDNDLVDGTATYSAAGTHTPANVGTSKVDAILVEIKTKTATSKGPAASRPGMNTTMLAEGPLAVAHKGSAEPAFHEPAGSTHDFDQVVIALGGADMSVSLDGKPAKTKWQRGDVEFIGRGVKHESKNTGGKPVDFIIVSVK